MPASQPAFNQSSLVVMLPKSETPWSCVARRSKNNKHNKSHYHCCQHHQDQDHFSIETSLPHAHTSGIKPEPGPGPVHFIPTSSTRAAPSVLVQNPNFENELDCTGSWTKFKLARGTPPARLSSAGDGLVDSLFERRSDGKRTSQVLLHHERVQPDLRTVGRSGR